MKVFLTGVTGFLGGELAVLLSKSPRIERVYCLVRAGNGSDALARLKHVFGFRNDPLDETKVIPIPGDLTDPELAESLAAHPELQHVETIIHAAADTSFAPASSGNVDRVNIGGTLQILKWSQSLKRLQTFVYVGTASICGTNLAGRHILEDESPNQQALHLVRYCHTKMLGEMHVTSVTPRDKLLIVRPSIIMGDSRAIKPRSYVILWALAAMNAIRLIPSNPQASLDVIPVDYAANALVELLFSKRRWTTYHISAGKDSATNLEKLLGAVESFSQGLPEVKFIKPALLSHIKKWPKKLQASSELHTYGEHLDYWSSAFNGNLRIIMAGMEPYFRFIELDQTFDNSRLLADTGLPHPTPPHDYLKTTGKYLSEIDLVEGAQDP